MLGKRIAGQKQGAIDKYFPAKKLKLDAEEDKQEQREEEEDK